MPDIREIRRTEPPQPSIPIQGPPLPLSKKIDEGTEACLSHYSINLNAKIRHPPPEPNLMYDTSIFSSSFKACSNLGNQQR